MYKIHANIKRGEATQIYHLKIIAFNILGVILTYVLL